MPYEEDRSRQITGGVALFFAVYLGWAYYKDRSRS